MNGRRLIRTALVAPLVAGCATQQKASDPSDVVDGGTARTIQQGSPPPAPSGFRRLAPTAGEDEMEIELFSSMRQLVTRSDIVIVGTVTGGRWGEEYLDFESDDPGDVVTSRDLIYEIHVDHAVAGRPVSATPDVVDAVMDLADPPFKLDPPVGEQAIFFLRRIGAPIPGVDSTTHPKLLSEELYRPVSSLGVLDEDRGHLAFPMGGADWARDFLQLSWDQAIGRIESLVPR